MSKTLIAAALLSTFVASAFAQTAAPAVAHPRRAEVNARLVNQNRRIDDKLATGAISPAKAAKLHTEDRRIHREERTMASLDGGHITKGEQRALNHQENQVGRQIGK